MLSVDEGTDFSIDVDLEGADESPRLPLMIESELNPFDPNTWASRMRLVGGTYTGRAYHQTPRLVSSPRLPRLR